MVDVTSADSKLDSITGVLLRPFFLEAVEAQCTQSPRDGINVLAVEISRFGFVNDSVGPALGDQILGLIARRLTKMFPDALAIGRLHGDHFSLAFDSTIALSERIEKLLEFVQRPLAVGTDIVVLSIRVGVVDAGAGITEPMALLHAAEVALHQSKDDIAKVTYFDPSMIDDAKATHSLENDLRVALVVNANELHRALHNREFFLEYQPIFDESERKVHAVEALLRWNHPEKGIIGPERFIAMAEEIRIMDVLGGWTLRRACLDAAAWPPNADGSYPLVSVNVSETQFIEPELLLACIKQALEESRLAPERLQVEVTESMAILAETGPTLAEIRALGCQTAMDDFGTGYSSLAQMLDLPLDYLKIDQAFVKNIGNTDKALASKAERFASVIIRMGDMISLRPIVEGVERRDQLDTIRKLGGELVQGYVYSRPMPQDELEEYLINAAKEASKLCPT